MSAPAAAPLDAALILAAGLGTRLRPLTLERPKPLVEVLGTPLVDFALAHAKRAGAKRVALNTHHLHPALEQALGTERFGLPLTVLYEPKILGTGGGIRGMAEALGGLSSRFCVLNADALIDLDLGAMLAAHDARRPAATLALKDTPGKERFGLIGTGEDGLVRSFAGRTKDLGPVDKEHMFCGVHVLEPALLSRLPFGQESCINRVGYPPLLDEGGRVLGFDVPGYFCDVGTKERLFEANLLLLQGRSELRHLSPFARFTRHEDAHGQPVYLAPGAEVHGAALVGPCLVDAGATVAPTARVGPLSVVGKGCRVGEGATLERAVLQSGAVVARGEQVQDAILGATCRLEVDPALGQALAARAP